MTLAALNGSIKRSRTTKLPIVMLAALGAGACSGASESPAPAETVRSGEVISSPKAHSSGAFATVPGATRGFPSVVTFDRYIAGRTAVTDGDDAVALPPELLPPELMDQLGGDFVPGVLLARPGQPIEFRNSEDVLHNVHIADLETHATVANVATLPGER